MVFENGDVYQGELMGGAFWGKGVYYSPNCNETFIFSTDEKEQRVEKEFQGYVMIDIVPSIGVQVESSSGLKGSALKSAV